MKKQKKQLSSKEKIYAYIYAPWYKKGIARARLSKEEKLLAKKIKKEQAASLRVNKSNFDKKHNAFEIRDWNVWFGTKKVLHNINLNIEKNKVTALIGPNGSGKTAFLRSLNRMNTEARTSGSIYFFNGTNLYSPKIPQVELTTRVGMIFQKPSPFPMSIYDNVAYGPRSHGITNKKTLDEIVKQSLDDAALWDEVKDKLGDYGTSLSGGQQQRLCIARAIALKPEVLLMDQPTGGLDPVATTFIENLILQLKEKFTIVLVTHSLNQAQRVSDKTVFFYEGHVCESGNTKQIFTSPKEKKTRDYILGK